MKFYVGSDQKPIFAHRCIMSARCAVFKAMLSEAAVIGEKETPFLLTDVSPKIFLTMLEFIYTNCVTLSPDTVSTEYKTQSKNLTRVSLHVRM